MAENASERDPLLQKDQNTSYDVNSIGSRIEYRVYTRRWYMLFVLCLLNFSNAMIWISFAPVADYSASYYNRSLSDINWLSIVFLLVCFLFGLGASWVLDTLGLRTGVLVGAWLNGIGAGLRIISGFSFIPLSYKFTVVMIGQSISSFAQPFVLSSPTKLAALWFGANERATANMLASLSNPLGVLVANVVAPNIVSSEDKIPLMLEVFAAPAFLGVVMTTLGFCSSVPPTPPSHSAASQSEPFFVGLKTVLRNKSYLVLMMAFGVGIGLFSCLSTILEQIICPFGYSDKMAGNAGAVLIGCGLLGGALSGWYVDKSKEFELTAKVSYGMSAITCCFFAMIFKLPDQASLVLVASGLFGFFAFALMPVCLELGVECTYPVAEATSAGLQWIMGQASGIILIIICQVLAQSKTDQELPDAKCRKSDKQGGHIQDLTWAMYFLTIVAVFVAIIFIILFKPRYHRLIAEREQIFLPDDAATGIRTLPSSPSDSV
ncbi:solute carrier family 49 member A3-like [Actinia tenebrosa]|uniref:Solute carrier family 49 member A3-like n=1 Tax=Actinia tenebrosa TaxID=6105 RepID=A0A6P8HVU8_ACTTE|nr:solute carrier family 49 member A3-like [Actinia tenebrosa]